MGTKTMHLRPERLAIAIICIAYFLIVQHFTMAHIKWLFAHRWANLTIGEVDYFMGYVMMPAAVCLVTFLVLVVSAKVIHWIVE